MQTVHFASMISLNFKIVIVVSLLLCLLPVQSQECEVTPTEPLGPFFQPNDVPVKDVICDPKERPADWPPLNYDDVRNITIYGKVLGSDCKPIDGTLVRLDAWHTDPYGEYEPIGDSESYCRAIIAVSEDGEYSFNTTYPGSYPSRPVIHIHYKVSAFGYQDLATQTYFKDDVLFRGSTAPNWLDLGDDETAEFDFVLNKLAS
eukprot:TRINITY_DN68531_c0_g1_i4.p2 TRINITY_DN68531_c0_g1~~TRINITY_DN68531_c0_g1_i4.p2  ORF type:complete len:203 (-),score=32.09 TRINITY_DN68531_c0_g1_i4:210-818(-)